MAYKEQFFHIFECVTPPTPDEMVWKLHPTLPIEASNLGQLRCLDEDDDYFERQRIGIHAPKRMKLVYECFNNTILPGYCRIKPRNSNPYDLRPENIEVILTIEMSEERSASLKREQDFRDETVKQMLLRETILPSHFNIYKYFKDLNIPDLCMKHWKAKSEWYEKHYDTLEI